ncbi:methyltransferase-like protein-like protein 10 [Amniculicola lignicola CBS 123094]|uniref:Protein-lysine N-methyltransferase EFM4 n=1 Tax=Amniculicola lignicola CBS 123094 TaxID=1392246 RepID=A0A6A5WCX8_9PLEO|nr:methyltransferase-like protein-like protein 10 [Amniculicola lignicola CBS 123094]
MPEHLDPSALGTKSYWDNTYTQELHNFSTNEKDEGTIWFEDAGAEDRMIAFLQKLADEDELVKASPDIDTNVKADNADTPPPATRFLDLGTGNGHLLFVLREEEWEGEMVGVDYSEKSIELAENISSTKINEEDPYIQFHVWDFLNQAPGSWFREPFDVVLDKGTFDAISLSEEKDERGRRICEGYREKVEGLVKKGGRLLITSCNWTEEELKGWIEKEGGGLVYDDRVEYPSFTFGGKKGQQVVTLCFKRR